jgi:hypothetical protein
MLLNLLVGKFKHLKAVSEGGLRGASISEVVNHLAVGEGLLHIFIGEVNNHVAVSICLPLHAICKNNFLFTGLVDSLDFAIVANHLIDYLLVGWKLVVVLGGEL